MFCSFSLKFLVLFLKLPIDNRAHTMCCYGIVSKILVVSFYSPHCITC